MTDTMARIEIPKTPPEDVPDDAVYSQEFADMIGVKRSSLKHYVQQVTAGSPATPVGFPPPDGRVLRKVPAPSERQPTRSVWSPWWHRHRAEKYKRERLPVGYQGKRASD